MAQIAGVNKMHNNNGRERERERLEALERRSRDLGQCSVCLGGLFFFTSVAPARDEGLLEFRVNVWVR